MRRKLESHAHLPPLGPAGALCSGRSGNCALRGPKSIGSVPWSGPSHKENWCSPDRIAERRTRSRWPSVRSLTSAEPGDVAAALLTPAHQFPLGMSCSARRRDALIVWARESGGLIIEDDYDGEFASTVSHSALCKADPLKTSSMSGQRASRWPLGCASPGPSCHPASSRCSWAPGVGTVPSRRSTRECWRSSSTTAASRVMRRPGLSRTSWQSRLAVGRGQGPALRPSTEIENWPSAVTCTQYSYGPVGDPGGTGQLCQVRAEDALGTGRFMLRPQRSQVSEPKYHEVTVVRTEWPEPSNPARPAPARTATSQRWPQSRRSDWPAALPRRGPSTRWVGGWS